MRIAKQISFLLALVFLFSCGTDNKTEKEVKKEDNKEIMLQVIEELEAKTLSDDSKFDEILAKELVKAYFEFTNNYHDDKRSPDYLFKAGDLSIRLQNYKQAIGIFENVHEGFPNYNKRPEAVYLMAFIYDTHLNDRLRAQEIYEKVIELYPNHHLATDAQSRLGTLFMTDEQMIEMFKKKNKEKEEQTSK